jgi:hypothetical protein
MESMAQAFDFKFCEGLRGARIPTVEYEERVTFWAELSGTAKSVSVCQVIIV